MYVIYRLSWHGDIQTELNLSAAEITPRLIILKYAAGGKNIIPRRTLVYLSVLEASQIIDNDNDTTTTAIRAAKLLKDSLYYETQDGNDTRQFAFNPESTNSIIIKG